MTPQTTLTIEVQDIGGSLANEVRSAGGISPMSCLQCAKCSSGCPVAGRADVKPHELVRLVQTNQRGAALSSRFIWECTSCQTCITRCPQKVDIAAMNDALRALSLSEKKVPSDIASPVFNEAFLKSVKKHGRVHELSLMASFKLRTKRFFEDFDKAPTMMKKGKLPLFGTRVGGRSERKELFRRAAEKASAGQKAPAAPGAGAAQGGQP